MKERHFYPLFLFTQPLRKYSFFLSTAGFKILNDICIEPLKIVFLIQRFGLKRAGFKILDNFLIAFNRWFYDFLAKLLLSTTGKQFFLKTVFLSTSRFKVLNNFFFIHWFKIFANFFAFNCWVSEFKHFLLSTNLKQFFFQLLN